MGQMNQGISLEALIAMAQAADTDDSWAMNQIVCRFKLLAKRLARTRVSAANAHLQDDLENTAYMALVRAVRRHDPRRIGFPAFAEVYMRGAVWREYARWLPKQPLDEGTTAPADPPPPLESVEDVVQRRLVPWDTDEVAGKIAGLSPSQKRLVNRRYVDDAPLALIAAEVGTSSSAVSQRLATIHRAVAEAIAA